MTGERIVEVCDKYEEMIQVWYPGDTAPPIMDNCYRMLPLIRSFVVSNKVDKAYRWLGFVQGVLYCQGLRSIDELRGDNGG